MLKKIEGMTIGELIDSGITIYMVDGSRFSLADASIENLKYALKAGSLYRKAYWYEERVLCAGWNAEGSELHVGLLAEYTEGLRAPYLLTLVNNEDLYFCNAMPLSELTLEKFNELRAR